MNNFILDANPFHLSGPPIWWLRKLWDFDPSLVVIPSKQVCCYRLCQRRPRNAKLDIVNESLKNESDTRMMASHSLIPVTTILALANWSNPLMFEELRARAPWRNGGADVVNAHLDEVDAKRELDKKAKTNEHLDSLAKDSWGLYKKKIGVKSHMWTPTVKKQSPTSKLVLA